MTKKPKAVGIEDVEITVDDLRAVGYCADGTRQWCEEHGIDFRDAVKNGISAADLVSRGHPDVDHLVRQKLKALGRPDYSEVVVTIGDIRKAGHCVSGAREWFRGKGLDFRAFLRDGMTAEELLKTNDPYAQEVIRKKLDRS